MIHALLTNPLVRVRSFDRQFVRPICLSMMCALMMAMVSVSSTVAMAQEELRPPKTTESPSSPKYLIFFVGVLLTAAVVVAVTRKAKRSHQD